MGDKVVVHYRDGRLVKGFTTGFSGESPSFEVAPLASEAASGPTRVELSDLKAVFFVKDFGGNSGYNEIKAFHPEFSRTGTRMEVGMFDGETLVGTVEGYRPTGLGFFLDPADEGSNNLRCFVVSAAVRRASIL
jgi:hypothetical protein